MDDGRVIDEEGKVDLYSNNYTKRTEQRNDSLNDIKPKGM